MTEIYSPPFDQKTLIEILRAEDDEFKANVHERLHRNELIIQGKLVQYKARKPYRKGAKRGVRGKVFGMSEASRMRLLKKLATWDWDSIGYSLFLTLTYPDERAMPLRDARNKHRYLIHRDIESNLGREVPCLWRVEYEVRKSGRHVGKPCPHWHLLLLGVEYMSCTDVNMWWRRIIDWKEYVRTEVKATTRAEGAARYIGKYLAKGSSSNSLVYASYHNDSGRHWGILREELIPVCEKIVIDRLIDTESEWLLEFAERFLPGVDSRVNTSFTLLGTRADECAKEFMQKRIDKTV